MIFKLKVCGMREINNIQDLVNLNPDYIGFIFYPKSKRFVGENIDAKIIASIPKTIAKVGVFVNETIENVAKTINLSELSLVQIHGDESAEYCKELKSKINVPITKAFQVDVNFDFSILEEYKPYCDYFLFDTKTENYGGSGMRFDWNILQKYDNEKPLFLSGGIDLEHIQDIVNLKNLNIHALDINSKFEIEPGLKDIGKIKIFKNGIQSKR